MLNALFVVMLAFYTVFAWTSVDAAEHQTRTEAAGLVEIYWQAARMPEPGRGQIRALIREYANEAAGPEWAALEHGQTSPKADDLLVAVRAELTRLPVESDEVRTARVAALQTMRDVTDARRARINEVTRNNPLLWLLLAGTVVGALGLIVFPLLVGISPGVRHTITIVLLASGLAFALYFALDLDEPLQGMIRIGPDAFQDALAEFTRIAP